VLSYTAAGGGYGAPKERDAGKVRRDLVEGWITAARARDVYGVVLRDDGSVDRDATARLRRT
jgi:N-methylhydantoinase B